MPRLLLVPSVPLPDLSVDGQQLQAGTEDGPLPVVAEALDCTGDYTDGLGLLCPLHTVHWGVAILKLSHGGGRRQKDQSQWSQDESQFLIGAEI